MAVISDPISDFLIRFKNAARAEREEFVAPHSKMKEEIARILTQEGYLWGYEVSEEGQFKTIISRPKYLKDAPVLQEVKRMSKPGRRQYVNAREIPRVLSGLGISIISTSRGILTGAQARRMNVGGELLAYVW